MTFGGVTVTFVTVSDTGAPGWGGLKAEARTEVTVAGCHVRPVSVSEVDGQTNVASERWKITAPPVAAALNASPTGEVRFGGGTFLIDGPVQPKRDMAGELSHVTVLCKRQMG